jgi:hypothetical protein
MKALANFIGCLDESSLLLALFKAMFSVESITSILPRYICIFGFFLALPSPLLNFNFYCTLNIGAISGPCELLTGFLWSCHLLMPHLCFDCSFLTLFFVL